MITAGVDLSSQAARTASCVIEWCNHRATVSELSLNVPDSAIVDLVAAVDKVGIDVPLGWPIAFAEAIMQHSLDGTWPADYSHADTSALRLRRTDLWAWRLLGSSPPLSVSTDRIALPAMRAAALLSSLAERMALDGSGIVVEAYPAAALRRWDRPSRGYKGKANSEARVSLVTGFLAQTKAWLAVDDEQAGHCLASDDAFDALIAALVARAAAVGLVEPVPEMDRLAARREGWIAVPLEGSLGALVEGS
jgi:predicted nuclease with RNAse H fold